MTAQIQFLTISWPTQAKSLSAVHLIFHSILNKLFCRAALQNNFFNSKGKIYNQIDWIDTMGSLLGSTLANEFLCFHEQIGLMNVLMNSNLSMTADMLMKYLFCFAHWSSYKFKNYLNSKHRNMRFTREKGHNNFLPFSDVLITRTSNGFKTTMYHKPTFGGVYSNFSSFISEKYKAGLIFPLLFWMF